MKYKALFAGLAISLASSVSGAATCSSTPVSLGSMGPPGFSTFGGSFSSAGTYYDCFSFSLSGNAKSFGGTLEVDPFWNKLNISLKSVSLFSQDGTRVGNKDTSPLTFSFGNLAGGALYTLQVVSNVIVASGIVGTRGKNDNVGYAGVITTLASPAPEPAAYALAAAGLAIVGVSAWRRRRP